MPHPVYTIVAFNNGQDSVNTSVDLPNQTVELSMHRAHAAVFKAIMLAEFSLLSSLILKSPSPLLQISKFG
jgi:hypothetical protein